LNRVVAYPCIPRAHHYIRSMTDSLHRVCMTLPGGLLARLDDAAHSSPYRTRSALAAHLLEQALPTIDDDEAPLTGTAARMHAVLRRQAEQAARVAEEQQAAQDRVIAANSQYLRDVNV
jgi:metal-responsive CopG/Arc/MetJ family transcriptional regulator